MTAFENVTNDKKVRAALHRDVRTICTECCHFLGLDITKDAMEIIAELVFMKVSVYGTDLEAFAKHAKRTQINTDDVKLLVRRNPLLKSHITSLCSSTTVAKEKRRKTVTNPPKSTESPSNKPDNTSKESLETPTTKPKEPEVRPSTSRMDTSEAMVVDDAIDLTFDD